MMKWLYGGLLAVLVACGPVPPSNTGGGSGGSSAGNSRGTVFAMRNGDTGERLPDLRLEKWIGKDAIWASADNSLRLRIEEFGDVNAGFTSFNGQYYEYGVEDEASCPRGARRDFEGRLARQWGDVLFETGNGGDTITFYLGKCGGEISVPAFEGRRRT